MLRVNDAYCRMVQKPRSELEGQPLTIVHTAANADFVLGSYQKRVDTKTLEPRLETASHPLERQRGLVRTVQLPAGGARPGAACVLCIFRDVTQRKQAAEELERLHRQLLEVSRQAGMAEVATSVLHNVGNVLNSVNVSSSLIADRVRAFQSAEPGQGRRAAPLTCLRPARVSDRGPQRPAVARLPLQPGRAPGRRNKRDACRNSNRWPATLTTSRRSSPCSRTTPRCWAWSSRSRWPIWLKTRCASTPGRWSGTTSRCIREYFEVPPILVDKHKVLQILVNLIRNAKYALDDRGHRQTLDPAHRVEREQHGEDRRH